MSANLSNLDLLGKLQVNDQNAVVKMARESGKKNRRHHYEEAIEIARNAVHSAGSDPELQSIARLYLSAALYKSRLPDGYQESIRESTRAIRDFSLHTHNRVIAQIMRAKFQSKSDEPENKLKAMEGFSEASQTLHKLIKDAYEHHHSKEMASYDELVDFVDNQLSQLHSVLTTTSGNTHTHAMRPARIEPEEPVSGQRRANASPQTTIESQYGKIRDKLPILTRLLWPSSEPAKVELLSAGDGARLDYIDVSRISLDGEPFSLEPVVPVSGSEGVVRLQVGKQYFAYPVEGKPDQRVLIRRQKLPDQERQLVVAADPVEARVWIDDAESKAPYHHIHILGQDRTWDLDDVDQAEPYIIGIVEAIMTRLGSS
jgi:hypothetical protein